MAEPNEIIASPLEVYAAAVGSTFPDLDATPSNVWTLLGESGSKNYDESGVTVTHSQSIETFTGAGGTAPRKAFRTEESLTLEFELVDLGPDAYAQRINDATVTTVAPTASKVGESKFDLYRGTDVAQFALMARGPSTVEDGMALQFEWPTVYESGEPAPVFTKGEPAKLLVQFTVLEVVAGQYGQLRVQTANKTGGP